MSRFIQILIIFSGSVFVSTASASSFLPLLPSLILFLSASTSFVRFHDSSSSFLSLRFDDVVIFVDVMEVVAMVVVVMVVIAMFIVAMRLTGLLSTRKLKAKGENLVPNKSITIDLKGKKETKAGKREVGMRGKREMGRGSREVRSGNQ